MGAHSFSTYSPGADMQSAFISAKEQAAFEYGADSYNGTISTVRSCVAVLNQTVPHSSLGAIKEALWEKEDGRTIRKWESCAAVPVSSDDHFDWQESTVTITYKGHHLLDFEVTKEAAAALGLHSDVFLAPVKYEVLSESEGFEETSQDFPDEYVLFCQGHLLMGTFSSLEEARSRAQRHAESSGNVVSVLPVGGAGMEVTPKERSYKIEATVRWAKKKAAPIEGWCFFGLAAS